MRSQNASIFHCPGRPDWPMLPAFPAEPVSLPLLSVSPPLPAEPDNPDKPAGPELSEGGSWAPQISCNASTTTAKSESSAIRDSAAALSRREHSDRKSVV